MNKNKQIEVVTEKAIRKDGDATMCDLLNQEIEELTNRKEIEEMAKVMCGNDCEECAKESANFYGQTLEEARNNKCLLKNCAKTLYEQGYQKVKDKVVLDKEVFYKNYVLIDELLIKDGLVQTLKQVAAAQEKKIKLLKEELAKASELAKQETAEKYQTRIDELEEEIDMLIKEQKEDRSYEIEQARKETAREIIEKVDDMIGGKMIAQALREIYLGVEE